MKTTPGPRVLLSATFALLLTGFLLPLLMVMQVIESSLFLNFFAYVVILLGSILGFVSITTLAQRRRR